MQIQALPVLKDNYLFILYEPALQQAAVVDPAVVEPVLDFLDQTQAKLVAIFNTHHHGDHVGANQELLKRFPELLIYASDQDRGRIPGQNRFLQAGDRLQFGERTATVIFVPGHTAGHIAYYFEPFPSNDYGDLFCGDTLFAGGCGRLKEGTPAQMFNSLNQLQKLPDTTRVWCAHEYTLNNLKFALTIEPNNRDLQERYQQVERQRLQGKATIPSVLGVEKNTNPFLRIETFLGLNPSQNQDPVELFAHLRALKDKF